MATKPGLSVERHLEIGERLYAMYEELVHLTVEVGNAYPVAAKFPRAIRRATEALSQARSEGDNRLANEHPHQFDPRVYYPGGSERR